MKKKDLPIVALQALNRVNVQLWKTAETKEEIIQRTFNSDNLARYSDIETDSEFKFELLKIDLSKETPMFSIELSPSSTINNETTLIKLNEKQLIIQFQTWIGWMSVYERSFLTPEEEFLKKYEEEFYTEFEIIDEDANNVPFDLEQQIFLDQYLSNMEMKLLPESKNNQEVANIIEDIKLLRNELGKETKKKIIKNFSSIFAKLRKSSIKLLGEFYSVAKKELIKRMISGGLDEISGLIQ